MLSLDKTFDVYTNALRLQGRRAEVLANNIANSETPGFKARDIDFSKELKKSQQFQDLDVRLEKTTTQHLGLLNSTAVGDLQYRIPTQVSVDGNTVDMDQEKVAYAANALGYQASLSFLSGDIKNMLSAIRGE